MLFVDELTLLRTEIFCSIIKVEVPQARFGKSISVFFLGIFRSFDQFTYLSIDLSVRTILMFHSKYTVAGKSRK